MEFIFSPRAHVGFLPRQKDVLVRFNISPWSWSLGAALWLPTAPSAASDRLNAPSTTSDGFNAPSTASHGLNAPSAASNGLNAPMAPSDGLNTEPYRDKNKYY